MPRYPRTLTEKLAALRVEMSDLDTTLATHYRAAAQRRLDREGVGVRGPRRAQDCDAPARTETPPANNHTGGTGGR